MSDDLFFIDEDDDEIEEDLGVWKILIVDDEFEVYVVIKFVLNDFFFNGKILIFVSVYSGEEVK